MKRNIISVFKLIKDFQTFIITNHCLRKGQIYILNYETIENEMNLNYLTIL